MRSFQQVTLENSEYRRFVENNESENIRFGFHSLASGSAEASEFSKAMELSRNLSVEHWSDHGSGYENIMRFGWNRRSERYYVIPEMKKAAKRVINFFM